tara:strand:+ start:14784 stop:16133 length:1350 start_codon:yes stop_codon:yes gene_type:complete
MTYAPTFFESDMPAVERCFGHQIKFCNGNIVKDLTGGITSHSVLSWGDNDVADLVHKQLLTYSHLDYKTFHDPMRERLAKLLVKGVPQKDRGTGWSVFYPGLSGSDGIEGALKLAYQFHCAAGEPERSQIVSFRESYHGSTLGAMSLGDRPNLDMYSPLFPNNIHRLEELNSFRPPPDVMNESDLLNHGIKNFEAVLRSVGPSKICCIVGETISGGLTGYVKRPTGYWRLIKEMCHRHGIILILDEIICGPGVSGTYYCWEQDRATPDITVMGKTLAGGYFPCNALLVKDEILDTIRSENGRIQQTNTFQGHSVALAVAEYVQKKICDEEFLGSVRSKGAAAVNLITDRLHRSARFQSCTGRGMRYSVQLRGELTDSFARQVTKSCENDAKLLVDGKWHRFTFSPQLDMDVGELLDLTSTFCDIFLNTDSTELKNLASEEDKSDPQRRY